MSEMVGSERCSIVATHLVDTGSERSRTVVVAYDDVRVCRETTLEVRSYRCDEDDEHVLFCRTNAYLCRCTDEERTDVECCAALVCRDVLLIEAHYLLHHLLEYFCRQLRHHDAAACRLQTCCVLVHTEHAHLAVGATICLQSLKGFLSVVQTGGCHVKLNVLVGADFYLAPLAIAVATAHVIVGRHIAERQLRPCYIFHKTLGFNTFLFHSGDMLP